MKKVTTLLFLFLFLVANSGMAVTVHYCGGKISSLRFGFSDAHPCKCRKKAMKPGCCKDKTTILKANDELAKVNPFSIDNPGVKLFTEFAAPLSFGLSGQYQFIVPTYYRPPPSKPCCPLYLMDRVLRI